MNIKLSTINFNKPKIVFRNNQKAESKSTEPALERTPSKDSFEISIGYINDTHGQTNNMMRILSGLKGDLKLSAGDNDIGDEKNKPVHRVTAKFLNIADIKASALGNHEMDTTQADLMDTAEDFKGDFLAANINKEMIEDEDSEIVKKLGRAHLENTLKKHKIVEVKGEKIGLIGTAPMDMHERLTHPNYHTDCHIDELEDTIKDVQEEVDNLRSKGINKIILLSHIGLKNDKILAQNTEGIDVILSGHTHELIRDIKDGENLFYSTSGEPVIIAEAGRDGNYFGELNLTFDKEGIITKAQNNLADTGLYPKNMVNQYIFDSILGVPEKIGYIEQAPPPPKSVIEENPHANFVCDIMKAETDSDIAIWHNCGVRNFFHEGEINSRDIKDISPFLDFVVTANVSEATIVDLFKTAIKTTYAHKELKPGIFAVSGLNYTLNPTTRELVEMNFIDKDGKEHKIDVNNPRKDKTYKVVTDEFLMSAGADFNILAPEEDYIDKYPYDKDVMICNYIKKMNEPVIINHTGRIKFVTDNS